MKIQFYFTSIGLPDNLLIGKTIVVIDVLRTTTVAAVALSNGARDVIPMASLGDASSLKQKLGHSSVLLGGERGGLKVEGFDLGNSPFEYESGTISGKSIVLATTNGSAAILRGNLAAHCFSCALINVSAISEKLRELNNDVSIICAGNEGGFSLEDTICGGLLIGKLRKLGLAIEFANDAASVALELYEKHKDNLEQALRQSDHGKFLRQSGFERDVAFCAREDQLSVCPILQSGRLILNA